MKVVVDNKIPFIQGVLEKHADVVYLEGSKIAKNDLLDADALIIRTRTKCTQALLEGTRVRFIATATIGYDHIDTAYCAAHTIAWTNAAGCNSSSVQQYIAGALFHLAGKLGFPPAEKTVGIVGVGSVGSKVANLCRVLGMKVLLNDPPRERVEGPDAFSSLDEIIGRSDIVTFHVPLHREGIDKTFHLADERLLARFKPNQILINSSRGAVVDNQALKALLQRRGLAACVLDVWEQEPNIDTELLGLVDIGTPHIAGYSVDGKAMGTSMSVRALSKFFNLGLDDWFPLKIPTPETNLISIDARHLNHQEILGTLIRATYNILGDDGRLRNSPGTFEVQRGTYPVRREFHAYTVTLSHADEALRETARTIGFIL